MNKPNTNTRSANSNRAAVRVAELIHAVAEVVNHDPRAPEVRIAVPRCCCCR
jgi:hypothetical protein